MIIIALIMLNVYHLSHLPHYRAHLIPRARCKYYPPEPAPHLVGREVIPDGQSTTRSVNIHACAGFAVVETSDYIIEVVYH